MGTTSSSALAISTALLLSASARAQSVTVNTAPSPQEGTGVPGLFIQVLAPGLPADNAPQQGSAPLQIVLPEGPAPGEAVPPSVRSSAAPAAPAAVAPQQTIVIQVNASPQAGWEVVPTGGYPQPNVFAVLPGPVIP